MKRLENLLFDLDELILVLFGEVGETVVLEQAGGVEKASKMHGVGVEAANGDAMVGEDVAIKTIMMPGFLIVLIFEVVFKEEDEIAVLSEVVDEKAGTISEVNFGAGESAGADELSPADWSFVANVDIDGFSIPGASAIAVLMQNI